MLIISQSDPRDPAATALLQQSHALMQDLFDPEENHYLEIEALCADHIRFYTARAEGHTLGTAALAIMDGYGEVKSMFVAPNARGKGVAAALMRQIEDTAIEEGLPMLRLETGDKLETAIRLYKQFGFEQCGPFGDYTANKTSVFMEKPFHGP